MKLKHIFCGLAAMGLMAVTSCTNLDETLYSQLNDSNLDFTNESDLSLLEGQAIAQFRYLNLSWFGTFVTNNGCTDIYCIPLRHSVYGAEYINLHKHNWDYTLGFAENNWSYAYQCIGYCNRVLDAISEDQPEKRAQMRFFRALTYYYLLDMHRNVPFQTTANVEAGYLPDQATPQELYDFCVSELQDIKDVIGTEKYFGYGNKYVVCMVLAKLYMNKNVYLETTGTDGYSDALEELNTIINEGGYSLAENYLDNFRVDIDTSPEVIFAIPGDATHAITFNHHIYLMPAVGMEAYGSSANSTNGSAAVPQFIDTYDTDDQRLTDTWAQGLQHYAVKNSDGTYTPNAGDPIPYTDDDWAGQGYLNYSKEMHSINMSYYQEGYRLHKYEIEGGTDKGTSADDICIYRYADVLMMKAECLLRLGQDKQTAANLVTQVRERSFKTNVTKATRTVADLEGGSCYKYGHKEYDPTSAYNDWSQLTSIYEGGDDIELGGLLDDLGWEFACEQHRRQDLIRFKMADGRSVFTGKSWFCKDASSDDHWEMFPIPDSAMRTNSKLKQNPGYTTSSTTSE